MIVVTQDVNSKNVELNNSKIAEIIELLYMDCPDDKSEHIEDFIDWVRCYDEYEEDDE